MQRFGKVLRINYTTNQFQLFALSYRYICFPIPQLKVSQDVETESKYSKIPIFSEKFEVPKPDTKPTKIEAKSCDIVKIPKRDADKLAKEIQEKNLRDRNMKEIHEIIDKKTMTIQPELRLDFKSHHVQKPDATKSIKFLNASSIMTTPDVNLDIPSTSNFKVMNPEKGKGKPLIYTMDFLEKDSWIDNVNHQISITLLDTSMLLTDNIFTSYQAGKKYSKLYKEIANAINSNFLNCPKLKEIPIEGQLVLAKFQQKYYRAMVLEIKESEIEVVYIDFGKKNYEISFFEYYQ